MKKQKLTLNEIYEAIEDTGFKKVYKNFDDMQSKSEDERLSKQSTTINKSIVDKDTEASNSIRNELEEVLNSIERAYKLIDSTLSSFNSPGLREAMTKAIRVGKDSSNRSFNSKAARATLSEYFNSK